MFAKLLSAAVDVVTLPVSVVVDAVTLGGALVDRDEPYTVSKVKRLGKDAGKVIEKLAAVLLILMRALPLLGVGHI